MQTTETRTTMSRSTLTKNPEIKELLNRVDVRPLKVTLHFHAGMVEVSGAWRVDVHTVNGTCANEEVTHWTGSDGEPNTFVKQWWTAPVVVVEQGMNRHGKYRPTLHLHIGNLNELCPERAAELTPAQLDLLWQVARSNTVAPSQIRKASYAEPGPFNSLTETTLTHEEVAHTGNAHTNMIDMLDL